MAALHADIVADELAIRKVVAKLARAQDDRDFISYRTCFTDQILIDQPMVPGWKPTLMSADEWTNTGLPLLAEFDVTHHRLCNHMISIDGDTATCEVDVSAVHQVIKGDDVGTLTIGGRYVLAMRREQGEWLISERALQVRYQIGDKSLMTKAISRAMERQQAT